MLPITAINLDLTAYNLTDKQVADFRTLFHFLMQRSRDRVRGNVMIPFDGTGNVGLVKAESYVDVGERKNGSAS